MADEAAGGWGSEWHRPGHMSAVGQLVRLDEHIRAGERTPGDLVALAVPGTHRFRTLIEV
ncbi:hypothetical protein [Streptomyces sp. NPDC018000]|uniref:hypothetical protein n=1 Tax=Streptomyces sp. NPDC018000 TaxID=3365028 RepID=UPI0037A5B9A0